MGGHDLSEEFGSGKPLIWVGFRVHDFVSEENPRTLGVSVKDDEAVGREKDEFGILPEGTADEKQAGGRSPALA